MYRGTVQNTPRARACQSWLVSMEVYVSDSIFSAVLSIYWSWHGSLESPCQSRSGDVYSLAQFRIPRALAPRAPVLEGRFFRPSFSSSLVVAWLVGKPLERTIRGCVLFGTVILGAIQQLHGAWCKDFWGTWFFSFLYHFILRTLSLICSSLRSSSLAFLRTSFQNPWLRWPLGPRLHVLSNLWYHYLSSLSTSSGLQNLRFWPRTTGVLKTRRSCGFHASTRCWMYVRVFSLMFSRYLVTRAIEK